MLELILAALAFVGGHLLISGTPVRHKIVAGIGEGPYLGLYSLLALGSFVWLIMSYRAAEFVSLWQPLSFLKPLALIVMLVATAFVVIGLSTPSPTSVGGESHIANPTSVTGILAVTRHPFLWGVSLWATIHLLINGDAASTVLFGALLVLSTLGTISIDSKRKKSLGTKWTQFAAHSSNFPFIALLQRRSMVHAKSIGWWRIGLAILVYAALLGAHRYVIGVSAL